MAGEKFIALEETSQEIKASVENVNTSVNEIKVDVGDGAGTDLVSRVAQLQAKVDQLLSRGNAGEVKLKKLISTYNDLPINKDINLIVLPAINYNETLDKLGAYISAKGVIKYDNITIANNGSYDDFPLLIGKKFTLNVSDSGVTGGIKTLYFNACYIFECE